MRGAFGCVSQTRTARPERYEGSEQAGTTSHTLHDYLPCATGTCHGAWSRRNPHSKHHSRRRGGEQGVPLRPLCFVSGVGKERVMVVGGRLGGQNKRSDWGERDGQRKRVFKQTEEGCFATSCDDQGKSKHLQEWEGCQGAVIGNGTGAGRCGAVTVAG